FNQQGQCSFCIGNDAEIRAEHATDLGRLDVDVYKLAALGEDVDRTGETVSPTVTDTEAEIGSQHRGIAITVRGLQTDHTSHQAVIVRNGTPAHQGRHDRDVNDFSEFTHQCGRVSVDNATTRDQQWTLGIIQHRQGALDLLTGCCWLVNRQWLVEIRIEFDLGNLYVERQIDQHWTWTTRTHDVESLLEHLWYQGWLTHHHRPLGHWC